MFFSSSLDGICRLSCHRHLLRQLAKMLLGLLASTLVFLSTQTATAQEIPKRPNIVFILADDLGYGELGCYGQKLIKTPNLDAFAARGMRFTQFYAGSTVCAPSRCVLMTGKHTGHCTIRGNARYPLDENEMTVARLLKSLGYTTGLIGKWGLGEEGSVGVPNRQGFDTFFGYLNQHHAHNSYPDFLYRNQEKIAIEGNVVDQGVASKKSVFAQDLFTKEALAFIDANKAEPFFLYWAVTAPHANNERTKKEGSGSEVPSDEPYSKEPWSQHNKNHAALVTALDRDVGKLLAKLRDLGLEKDTIVIFTSDNGPHREAGGDPSIFRASGPLRGIKRSLHEGGVRVPFLVVWPGIVQQGATNSHIGGFQDFLPTASGIAGGKMPPGIDGISFLPTLRGQDADQKQHDFLYWEFSEGGFQQAIRMGNWKAVRPKMDGPLQLFDLSKDLGETTDLAAGNVELTTKIEGILRNARTESALFPKRKGMK